MQMWQTFQIPEMAGLLCYQSDWDVGGGGESIKCHSPRKPNASRSCSSVFKQQLARAAAKLDSVWFHHGPCIEFTLCKCNLYGNKTWLLGRCLSPCVGLWDFLHVFVLVFKRETIGSNPAARSSGVEVGVLPVLRGGANCVTAQV